MQTIKGLVLFDFGHKSITILEICFSEYFPPFGPFVPTKSVSHQLHIALLLSFSIPLHRLQPENRMNIAGLYENGEVVLQDYRDEKGLYDAIVSIEMFEAVGEKYWPDYFKTLSKSLKSGARATLQIITIS